MLRGHWVLQPFEFHHPSSHKATLDRKYVCLCVHKKLIRIIPWFCICKFTYLLKRVGSTKPIVAALSVTSRHVQCSKAFWLLSMCTLPGEVKQGDTLRSCYYTIWSEDVDRKGQRTAAQEGLALRPAGEFASQPWHLLVRRPQASHLTLFSFVKYRKQNLLGWAVVRL